MKAAQTKRATCSCGRPIVAGGECAACRAKRLKSSVRGALREPGAPLPAGDRAPLEAAFGHDFRDVSVHRGPQARASSRALGARAWSAGRHIVLGGPADRRTMAHELAHVVQQGAHAPADRIGSPTGPAERAADAASARVVRGERAGPLSPVAPAVRRTLIIDRPAKASTVGGATNQAALSGYLHTLCSTAPATVDPAGRVDVPRSFCFPAAGGAAPAPAAAGSEPDSCSCLCDLVHSPRVWTLRLSATDFPNTDPADPEAGVGRVPGGTGGTVTVPPPADPRRLGAIAASGRPRDATPAEILMHELCGHARMLDVGRHSTPEAEAVQGRHHQTVPLENQITAEHGVTDPRGSMIDPFCGESYVRGPDGRPQFNPARIAACQAFRDRYNRQNGTTFRVQDRLPAAPAPGFQGLPPLPRLNPAGGLEINGFALGSAVLSPDHEIAVRETAARIVNLLRAYPNSFVTVDGHADEVGTAAVNEQVSQDRADAVRKALITNGVPADLVRAFGRSTRFKLPGTSTNDERNRRVEVTTVLRARTYGSVLNQGLTPPSLPAATPSGGGSTFTPRDPFKRVPSILDRGPLFPGLDSAIRPETVDEQIRRILRTIPPAPAGTARSPMDVITHAFDGILNKLTSPLPDWARDRARDGLRKAIAAGTLAPLKQALSGSGLPSNEQEAILKAAEALMNTSPAGATKP